MNNHAFCSREKGKTMLTDTQKEIIRVFAESGMNRTEAARRLFRHYNTVYYQLIRIKEKTELNPWDFFDLHELLRMAGAADYVDVVRCKDCMWSRKVDDQEPKYRCVNITRYGSSQWLDSNDYCSYGERKDDAENH
jgi:DNA-binding CsgD family transcriptional regulator